VPAPTTVVVPVTAAVTVATTAVVAPAPTAPTPTGLRALERAGAVGINTLRAHRGLRPLSVSAALARAAREHALSMVTRGYFRHDSFDGTPFWKRIARYYPLAGYRRLVVGENLYWSASSASSTAIDRAWTASAEHRRILFGDCTQLGVAIVHEDGAPGFFRHRSVVVAVADFGRRS
jgi:uncharacterized protein YkwD